MLPRQFKNSGVGQTPSKALETFQKVASCCFSDGTPVAQLAGRAGVATRTSSCDAHLLGDCWVGLCHRPSSSLSVCLAGPRRTQQDGSCTRSNDVGAPLHDAFCAYSTHIHIPCCSKVARGSGISTHGRSVWAVHGPKVDGLTIKRGPKSKVTSVRLDFPYSDKSRLTFLVSLGLPHIAHPWPPRKCTSLDSPGPLSDDK